MATLNYHPAAELFPMMLPAELGELCDSIHKLGLQEPIVVLDGQILDGRNRYEACKLEEIEPDLIHTDLYSIGGDPWAYVLAVNMHRRHLTPSQRAMIAQKMLEHEREEAEKRKDDSIKGRDEKGRALSTASKNCLSGQEDKNGHASSNSGRATERAGKAAGVNREYVRAADKVATKGTPELVKLVESNGLPVTTAAKIAELPAEEQEELVKEGPDTIKEAAKKLKEKRGAASNGRPSGTEAAPASAGRIYGDSFDTEELEQKSIKRNGKEVLPAAWKKAAMQAYGALLRALDRINVSADVEPEMRAILRAIKES